MPLQADGLRFLAGMMVATAGLHAAGVAAGLAAGRRSTALVRWAGAGIAASGVILLLA
jgi:urease accessory protein